MREVGAVDKISDCQQGSPGFNSRSVGIVLYCIVLYCIVLYCIVLYCTVLGMEPRYFYRDFSLCIFREAICEIFETK